MPKYLFYDTENDNAIIKIGKSLRMVELDNMDQAIGFAKALEKLGKGKRVIPWQKTQDLNVTL
jgi:hypothetical protein